MNMERERDIAAKSLLACFIIFYIITEIFATSKQFRFTGYEGKVFKDLIAPEHELKWEDEG